MTPKTAEEIAREVLGDCNDECTDRVVSADCRLHDCGPDLLKAIAEAESRGRAEAEAKFMDGADPWQMRKTEEVRQLVPAPPEPKPVSENQAIAAQCWCHSTTSDIEMDVRLAERITAALDAKDARADQLAAALKSCRAAMTYAAEDRCDQYYLNVLESINVALAAHRGWK